MYSYLQQIQRIQKYYENVPNTYYHYFHFHFSALELALNDSNLLSADLLLSACTLLGTLKQTNATAILNAAMNNSSRTSTTLSSAIDVARRDGVKQGKITEAETVLTKLRRDESIIAEIDASLTPALESKNLESLEINLLRATAHSVTSKTIESARQLVGQLRLQGDDKRIMLLLADALRLRSVSVLEHVIKSADDAGMYRLSFLLSSFPFFFQHPFTATKL